MKIDEKVIREVMTVYFNLFPTDNPYNEETEINKVVDYIYASRTA